MADQTREFPAVGGTILDRWPDIASIVAPQLPDHAAAVAFHPETGQLDLRPDSPAYTTQLRLISARIITAANEAPAPAPCAPSASCQPEQHPQTCPTGENAVAAATNAADTARERVAEHLLSIA
nr:DciA family protein [Streptomyces sp. YIM 132580]